MRTVLMISAAALAIAAAQSARAADCGTLTIANMNWQSGELLANVDKLILEAGYGCKVEFIPGDTVPTITSMVEKGAPDIAGEAWVDLVPEIVKRGVAEKKIVEIGPALSEGGVQGWFIPKFVQEAHPEITTVGEALKHPEIFKDPQDPAKGAVFNGPTGSGGSVVSAQLFKAFGGAASNFNLVDPGTQAGLDASMAKALERKQGWMGYYWSPTALLGKYPMVRLEAGVAHDDAEWKRCTTVADCADPKINDWSRDKVVSLISQKLATSGNEGVLAYLRQRSWTNGTVNGVMSWMTDNQASGEAGAKYFLEKNADVWHTWVPKDVAAKIDASLNK